MDLNHRTLLHRKGRQRQARRPLSLATVSDGGWPLRGVAEEAIDDSLRRAAGDPATRCATGLTRRAFLSLSTLAAFGVAVDGFSLPTPDPSEPSETPLEDRLGRENERLRAYYAIKRDAPVLFISASTQMLYVYNDATCVSNYPVSTGWRGVTRERPTKGYTPLGIHRIREKLGDDEPLGREIKRHTVTDRIVPIHAERPSPRPRVKGLILSRMLWLEGMEDHNKCTGAENVYLHGTNIEWRLGKPVSDGCIRMRNSDVVELYDLVPVKTYVKILA